MLDDLVVHHDVRLVGEADREAIADVDVRRSVLATDVVRIERHIATVEGAVVALHLTGVGSMRPGVVGQHFETVVPIGRRTVTASELYQVLATLKPVL